MAYQFTKDLETGNRTIDSQHQQLIAAVNALDACSKGAGRVQVQQTAQFLLNYTNQHFAAEEALQQKSRYPGYPATSSFTKNLKSLLLC